MHAEPVSLLMILFFSAAGIFTDEIVLQNGHNGYNGCTDTYIKINGDGTDLYPFLYFNTNYDTAVTIETANDDNCGGTYARALYHFDLSSVTVSSDNITKATFASYFVGGFDGIQKTYLYRVTKRWQADKATWLFPESNQSLWAPLKDTLNQGGCFTENNSVETTCAAEGTWEEYDITSILKFFITNPDSNYGFMIQSEKAVNNIQRIYYSSNYTDDITLRPKLIVEGEIAVTYFPVEKSNTAVQVTGTNEAIILYIPGMGSRALLHDLRGRTIKTLIPNRENRYVVPMSILSTGVYYLHTINDGYMRMVRFTVVK